MGSNITARLRAESLGVSVSTLYYKGKIPERDHTTRRLIEGVLREHPSYGHKRIALALKRNKKCILHRFVSLGELTAAIYETIYRYNNDRIHSALKMPPVSFARLHASATLHTVA